jgi:hypothetical protein
MGRPEEEASFRSEMSGRFLMSSGIGKLSGLAALAGRK